MYYCDGSFHSETVASETAQGCWAVLSSGLSMDHIICKAWMFNEFPLRCTHSLFRGPKESLIVSLWNSFFCHQIHRTHILGWALTFHILHIKVRVWRVVWASLLKFPDSKWIWLLLGCNSQGFSVEDSAHFKWLSYSMVSNEWLDLRNI